MTKMSKNFKAAKAEFLNANIYEKPKAFRKMLKCIETFRDAQIALEVFNANSLRWGEKFNTYENIIRRKMQKSASTFEEYKYVYTIFEHMIQKGDYKSTPTRVGTTIIRKLIRRIHKPSQKRWLSLIIPCNHPLHNELKMKKNL